MIRRRLTGRRLVRPGSSFPLFTAIRSRRLFAAALDGPAAMMVESFGTVVAHVWIEAAASWVLPVPGGPRARTSLCFLVRKSALVCDRLRPMTLATSWKCFLGGGTMCRT